MGTEFENVNAVVDDVKFDPSPLELIREAESGMDTAMNTMLELRNRCPRSRCGREAESIREEAFALYRRIQRLKEMR